MTPQREKPLFFDGMGIKKEGVLLIDKPRDWTSHDVVAVCRKYLGLKRIGHAGTLDPMATGLLIMLVGRSATKAQNKFLKERKKYTAVLKLGEETDTLDAHGAVIKTLPVPPLDLRDIKAAAQKLTGEIEHAIPLYSAKKYHGRAMHKLAREDVAVPPQSKKITVFSWENISFKAHEIYFTVEVSSGTYVRSLGKMLAQMLGAAGHLTELRRVSSCGYDVKDALTIEKLKTLPYEDLAGYIIYPSPYDGGGAGERVE